MTCSLLSNAVQAFHDVAHGIWLVILSTSLHAQWVGFVFRYIHVPVSDSTKRIMNIHADFFLAPLKIMSDEFQNRICSGVSLDD